MAADQVQLRFRHHAGDIGPITVSDATLIQQLKETLLAEWPKEGPLAKEAPQQAQDIKLILSGKWVDNQKPLLEYHREMGEIKPDTIVTFHVVIRPTSQTTKQQGSGTPTPEKQEQKGCGCSIS